jgi:mannan endo-1,4-beta-mannosidase
MERRRCGRRYRIETVFLHAVTGLMDKTINTMVRFCLGICFLLMSVLSVSAQEGEFIDNFDDGTLATHWVTTGTTFSLSEADEVLKIQYNRTGVAGTEWDQFHLNGVAVDIANYPYISLDIKSSIAFQLAVKPVSSSGDDWLTANVPGDNAFHNYLFEVKNADGAAVTNVYIYFDGGSNTTKAGNVEIDNFVLGFHYTPPLVTTALSRAIADVEKLRTTIVEGANNGQFPSGSKTSLQDAINEAQAVLDNANSKTQAEIDAATDALNDAAMAVESTVIYDNRGLIDENATKETVFLFKNLKYLSSQNKYLFGMHDATAYGINAGGSTWSDDGTASKSDVKQITGSHPAVFSQDVYDIVAKSAAELAGYRNRQIQAYKAGGVITLVWHMGDPVNDTFYYSDLNPAYNVVAAISPGGAHHIWFQNELKKLASYVKGLRGDNGEAIPVIFRPFHEHNGTWFWWGRTRCTTAEYNALWKFTVEYLRDELNVHNFIYAFSPDGNQYNTKAEYLSIYPGDTYVDVYGLDYYFGEGTTGARDKLRDRLVHIVEYADERNKIAALCEFGDRLGWDDIDKIEINKFYTTMVLAAVKANSKSNRISFLATWRNDNINHHFAPYPGHKEAADFMVFYDDPNTIFLNDVPELFYSLLEDDVPTSSEREISKSIELYPNPSSDVLKIKGYQNIVDVDIINSTGQVVKTIRNFNGNDAEVDVKSLPRGLYTVRITLGVKESAERKVAGKVLKN